MADKTRELRDRAAHEFKAARAAKTEPDRATHKKLGDAYKSLAESEAWLEGKIPPIRRQPLSEKN